MKRPNPLLAWHASPYDLPEGKFGPMEETSGRGQGAASYGRGAAYLAENPKVSGPGESEYMREFQNHPSSRGRAARWTHNGEVLEDQSRDVPGTTIQHIYAAETPQEFVRRWLTAYPKANIFPRGGGISGILRDLQNIVDEDAHSGVSGQKVKDALKWLKNRKNAAQFKRVDEPAGPFSYKVAVHTGEENLLDWDAQIGMHHPEANDKIRGVMNNMGDEALVKGLQSVRGADPTGAEAYRILANHHGSDFAASKALYNAGIHGIRYKDAGSRNYKPIVKFDGKELDPTIGGKDDMLLPTLVATWFTNAAPGDDFDKLKKFFNSARPPKLFGDKSYTRTYESIQKSKNFLEANEHRFEITHPKPTYNYVVFHPDLLETLEQYNIKGEKTKDYGPGVHLKAVEHDPFEGEDR